MKADDGTIVTTTNLWVHVRPDAVMSIPARNEDGSLLWRLNRHVAPTDADRLSAVSALESYIYLINHCTKEEAWHRIKLLRAAYRKHEAVPLTPTTPEKDG
tara:strand:+ start:11616 stop:11918 length:303 start_codon:yes stop_codon:yes gene_type:complete